VVRTKDEQAEGSIDALEEELEAIALDLDRVLAEREQAPAPPSVAAS